MHSRKLDDWLSGFLRYMDNTEPPELYKLWAGLSTIAAVLQRKCWVTWEKDIYPNMFVVLVGPSSCRKGTAMGPCLELLLGERSVRLAAESITREALIRKMKQCNTVDISKDGIPHRHASITVWSQELSVFLGHNNPQFLSALTDWYDCRDPWSYETISRGEDIVHGVCVNLIGATTPSALQISLPDLAVGGGLTSRIIFVHAERKGKIVDVPIRTPKELALFEDLSYDLSIIAQLSGAFSMDASYLEKRIAWRRQQDIHPPDMDYRFLGYIGRRATHLLKIGMAISASRDDSMILDGDIHDRALKILEWTERYMEKVYRGYGMINNAVLFPQLMADIASAGVMPLSVLQKRYLTDVSRDDLLGIMQTFEKIGFCKMELSSGVTVVRHIENEGNETV